jgi:hypothetical protein
MAGTAAGLAATFVGIAPEVRDINDSFDGDGEPAMYQVLDNPIPSPEQSVEQLAEQQGYQITATRKETVAHGPVDSMLEAAGAIGETLREGLSDLPEMLERRRRNREA